VNKPDADDLVVRMHVARRRRRPTTYPDIPGPHGTAAKTTRRRALHLAGPRDLTRTEFTHPCKPGGLFFDSNDSQSDT
jgi:hypothetical protein